MKCIGCLCLNSNVPVPLPVTQDCCCKSLNSDAQFADICHSWLNNSVDPVWLSLPIPTSTYISVLLLCNRSLIVLCVVLLSWATSCIQIFS